MFTTSRLRTRAACRVTLSSSRMAMAAFCTTRTHQAVLYGTIIGRVQSAMFVISRDMPGCCAGSGSRT